MGGLLIVVYLIIIDFEFYILMFLYVIVMMGIDVFVYVIECYIMKFVQLIMDVVVLMVIEYVVYYIKRVFVDGEDLEVRYGMVQVVMFVGFFYGSELVGVVYVMS